MISNLFKTASVTLLIISLTSCASNALDLKGALGNSSGAANPTTTTSPQASPSSGGLGSILSDVAGALGLAGNLKPQDLVGTWKYNRPAVEFKSDNFLMKAGGVAASQTVEGKLEPYYKMTGIENMILTVNNDLTFSMKLKLGSLSGTITQSEDGKQLFFNFAMLNSINIGTVEAFVTKKTSSEIAITYDVSGLISILEKVGSISGNSSLKTLTSLLGQYDGMTAGFDLKKQ